jgi:hypothetical protein
MDWLQCMDWRHLQEMLAGGAAYTDLKNLCVWVKNNGGMGSLYRSQMDQNVTLGKFPTFRASACRTIR